MISREKTGFDSGLMTLAAPTTHSLAQSCVSEELYMLIFLCTHCKYVHTELKIFPILPVFERPFLIKQILCLLLASASGPWVLKNSSINSGELELGQRVSQDVPPGVFWRSLLHLRQPHFLKFNISLGKDALFGVYMRKGLPPSHAQVRKSPHDLFLLLKEPCPFTIKVEYAVFTSSSVLLKG